MGELGRYMNFYPLSVRVNSVFVFVNNKVCTHQHGLRGLAVCTCASLVPIFLTLNIPTTHICVEIYSVIMTSNCGKLLDLEHWCFILFYFT